MRAALATLAVGACVALGLGAPAQAATLTKGKVQQIAARVVQQQAPQLTVAKAATAGHATTADQAKTADRAKTADHAGSAGDAAALGGRGPAAYLDRVAHALGSSKWIGNVQVAVTPPVTVTVPEGVGFVRVTGTAGFQSITASGTAILFIVNGTSCTNGSLGPPAHGATHLHPGSATIDRVVAVTPGDQTFALCGSTSVEALVIAPTLTVETVAVGSVVLPRGSGAAH
jgi:hypothetical protein